MNIKILKSAVLLLPAALLLLAAAGCAGQTADPAAPSPTASMAGDAAAEAGPGRIDLGAPDSVPAGVTYDDGVFTVDAAGAYRLTGTCAGRVVVDADGPVELTFDGAVLAGESCLTVRSGDPVTLSAVPGTVNLLTDTLPAASGEASAGASSPEAASAEAASAGPDDAGEAPAEEEPDEEAEDASASGAVISSRAPLIFTGSGSIAVEAAVNNAVRCKDDITVESGTLTVRAANNGLKVTGVLTILGGSLDVTAGGDGLAANSSHLTPGTVELRGGSVRLTADARGIDAEGVVAVSGGNLAVVSGDDGIRADTIAVSGGELTIDAQRDGLQALTDLTVSGGALSVTTGGGGGSAISHPGESFGPWAQSAAAEESGSAKGLKSDGSITVSGGALTLNSADDSIHCATLFTMDGGNVTICSNDDAIHSDDWLVIRDGTVRIDDCFEGLEAFAVEIHGGDVVIRAVNDGINANVPEMMFRRSSDTAETETSSLSGASVCYVLMAGGRVDLVVTGSSMNQGDGIDSNGAVYVTGGELVVSTFGTFMENGLDTGWGGPVVTGGKVLAGGSSTMAEGFSSYSTQCAAVVATSYMPDGTEVVLSDAAGNVLWDVVLADAFSCLQISHPDMQVGEVYTLTYGSQSTTLDFTDSNLVHDTGGFGFRPF